VRFSTVRGDTIVVYGFECSGIGFFTTIIRDRRKVAAYDALRPGYDGLRGLLRVLVETAVVTQDDVDEAVFLLPHVETAAEIDDRGARFVATILLQLRSAAEAS
jgi:hypothetical protein